MENPSTSFHNSYADGKAVTEKPKNEKQLHNDNQQSETQEINSQSSQINDICDKLNDLYIVSVNKVEKEKQTQTQRYLQQNLSEYPNVQASSQNLGLSIMEQDPEQEVDDINSSDIEIEEYNTTDDTDQSEDEEELNEEQKEKYNQEGSIFSITQNKINIIYEKNVEKYLVDHHLLFYKPSLKLEKQYKRFIKDFQEEYNFKRKQIREILHDFCDNYLQDSPYFAYFEEKNSQREFRTLAIFLRCLKSDNIKITEKLKNNLIICFIQFKKDCNSSLLLLDDL